MFSFCTNPDLLADAQWWACYLTTGKHVGLYWAVGTVLLLLLITAPLVLALGFLGAMAARSSRLIFSLLGRGYIAIVRGVPDIAYFLFFVIALDQILEWLRHKALCRDWSEPIRQGNDFVVCDAAKLPLSSAAPWVHDLYGFALAVFTFGIVFGAFASNVIYGAMRAVPKAQLETGAAYGMTQSQVFWRILVPQMWVYALPGLGNIWILFHRLFWLPLLVRLQFAKLHELGVVLVNFILFVVLLLSSCVFILIKLVEDCILGHKFVVCYFLESLITLIS
ncbi:MAG: ABC transporter permease subunit [Paracoccaceae bacterium]